VKRKRALILGCGLALLALAGCSGANQQRVARPTWPPGAYIGPSWPVATYVFLSSPNPNADIRAVSVDADAVIGAASRYLPTRDFAILLPDPRNDYLVRNPTIRLLRLLAYARARSPAPVWLVGTMQDINLVLHGVPAIPARAFAGFVLLPMTEEGCGTPPEMQEAGLDGMPTVTVGMGSAACANALPPMATLPPPAPITAPYHQPLGVMPDLPPGLQPNAPSMPQATTPPATTPPATTPPTTTPPGDDLTMPGAPPLPLPPTRPTPPAASPVLAAPALPSTMPFQRVQPEPSGPVLLKTAPKPPVSSQPLPAPNTLPAPSAPPPPAPPAPPSAPAQGITT
jgi:hypothetical protein